MILAVPVAALAIAATLLIHTPGSAPEASAPAPLPSIALLPVVNLSGSEADGYFAQGLTAELISAFAKTPRIRVVAPSSLFEVKRMAADLQGERGRNNLKVHSVLQCSIRKAGERVRLTAHLTQVGDGSSIWAETYEHEVADAFAAQEQLADVIVSAVQHELLDSLGTPGGLRKAYKERCMALVSLKVDPRFTPLRQEPEFGALLTKMGLEPN